MPPPSKHFQLLRGFAIILAFTLVGQLLSATLIPLPGPVIGLILLATALFTDLIKIHWVESGANALLQNLMLFFVPALVGALDLLPILGNHTVPFLLAILISLITVLIVTGTTATLLTRRPPSSAPAPPTDPA
ncbi:CidA/LrgA family protein [Phragmitibacter flavus]|uniref:CidA/LrgA family protein n=1 Tax=Phragmitibacter flavus TaxID=2576071 RepID=A0A5R8KJP0_9BACT|nr:CidA/LrgA family protein [Phragmitibacter flavus]TLD72155.1 CidA/LrgA family protein [Phragmitibacter flavus]